MYNTPILSSIRPVITMRCDPYEILQWVGMYQGMPRKPSRRWFLRHRGLWYTIRNPA